MTDSDSAPAARKPRWTGCLLAVGIVAFVLLALLISGYVIWSATSARKVREQLVEIRSKGEPASVAELDASYTLPQDVDASENTTELLLTALGPLTDDTFGVEAADLPVVGRESERTIPPVGQAWPEREQVERLLEKHRESMVLLHEAADKGAAARFDLKFSDGLAMRLEHAQDLRQAARMLKLEAHVRAHRGELAGTVDSLRAGFRIGRSLDREPTLISQMINIAIRSVALQSIQELVPQADFSDEQLAVLQQTIREADFSQQMRHALLGERVIAIEVFQDPSGMLKGRPGIRSTIGPRNDDLSLYLELIAPLIERADEPWLQQRAAVDQSIRTLEDRMASPIAGSRYTLTSLLFPAVKPAFDAQARAAAFRDLVDCQLAVQRHRLAHHGQPPALLSQLVPGYLPAVPSDPFDGQPLRYVVDPQEVRIYSIGRDATDDGGQGGVGMSAPDEVVRLPLEARKR